LNNPGNQGFRGGNNRMRKPETPDAHRVNHRITAREVRLISDSGEQLGIIQLKEALTMAENAGLDLVEVSPEAKPPVCRLMDYGKFKYREQKKEAEARKKRFESETKELRIRYRTDVGDLETKLKQAREFLTEGHKVKFTMRFKGREAMYIDLGVEKIDQIIQRLSDVATIDDRSPPIGKQIHITFAPAKQSSSIKETSSVKESAGH
jgi:translation initiation factor IF-3